MPNELTSGFDNLAEQVARAYGTPLTPTRVGDGYSSVDKGLDLNEDYYITHDGTERIVRDIEVRHVYKSGVGIERRQINHNYECKCGNILKTDARLPGLYICKKCTDEKTRVCKN